jgi:hypothetical protein
MLSDPRKELADAVLHAIPTRMLIEELQCRQLADSDIRELGLDKAARAGGAMLLIGDGHLPRDFCSYRDTAGELHVGTRDHQFLFRSMGLDFPVSQGFIVLVVSLLPGDVGETALAWGKEAGF